MEFIERLKGVVEKNLPAGFSVSVDLPIKPEFGDYSAIINLKGNKFSQELFSKIKKDLEKDEFIKENVREIKVVPPVYFNFFLKPEKIKEVVREILKKGENFGSSEEGKNRIILIDYSSPNIAKPMHVGHLRSTFIGQAIYNLYKFLGYKVIGDNHLGDWGTQFGMIIGGCKRYLKKSEIKKITIQQMLDVYIRFNKEIEEKPELQELAKLEFKKLEQNDSENKKIWKILRKKSLEEFNRIYKILGIKFDIVKGESDYQDFLKDEIENALKKGAAIKNEDGSVIIPLKGKETPFLIQKSDGATVYGTRDLATIRFRIEKYHPEKIVYVIGNEQSFYLEQLFNAAEILGYISRDRLYHVKFGLVLDENRKKLATREGRVIGAEELIQRIIALAERVIKEKNPKLNRGERTKAAKIIGVGALKYNDLSQNRHTDIVFDWKKMLSFEGNSAPYLLYTYVRLKSILRKSNFTNFDPSLLSKDIELEIIKRLSIFPLVIRKALDDYQLNIIANYLFELAGLINNFYEEIPVLKAEKKLKFSRLALIKSAAIILKRGLNLLGIETLEKM